MMVFQIFPNNKSNLPQTFPTQSINSNFQFKTKTNSHKNPLFLHIPPIKSSYLHKSQQIYHAISLFSHSNSQNYSYYQMINDAKYWEQRHKGLNDQYTQLKNAYSDLKDDYSEQFRLNDTQSKEINLLKQRLENTKSEHAKAVDDNVKKVLEIELISTENEQLRKRLNHLENENQIITQKYEELKEKLEKLEKQEIRRSSNSESLNEFSRSVCSKMPKMLDNLSLFMPNNGLRDRNFSDLSTVLPSETNSISTRTPNTRLTPGGESFVRHSVIKHNVFDRSSSDLETTLQSDVSSNTGKTPQANPDQGLDDFNSETRFFEAFFVLGVPDSKLSTPHSPAEILYEFSSNSCQSFNKNILADFCFPSDPKRRQLRESTSEEEINNILFGAENDYRSCNCYVFTLICPTPDNSTPNSELPNSDKQYIYCICYQFEDIAIENKTRLEWINTKCLCIVSFVPCFELHFKFLNSLIQLKKLWRMESIAEFDNVRASLRCNSNDEYPPKWEEMLKKYFKYDEINPGCVVSIEDSLAPCIEFRFADDLSNVDVSWLMHSLRSAIEAQDFLCLFSALLQEKSIVFVSYNLDLLTSCVLGMQALLRPCKWPYFFLPLIPDNLRELLDAPIPILAGIPGSAPDCRKNMNHIIWVLLDECMPKRKIGNPEVLQEVQELPSSSFKQDLLAIYSQEGEESKVPYLIKRILNDIFDRFKRKSFNSVEEILKLISDDIPPHEHNFYLALTQTQLFYSCIEKWIAW